MGGRGGWRLYGWGRETGRGEEREAYESVGEEERWVGPRRGRHLDGTREGGGIVGVDRREKEAKWVRGECRLGAPVVVVLEKKCCISKMIMEYYLFFIYQVNLFRFYCIVSIV